MPAASGTTVTAANPEPVARRGAARTGAADAAAARCRQRASVARRMSSRRQNAVALNPLAAKSARCAACSAGVQERRERVGAGGESGTGDMARTYGA